ELDKEIEQLSRAVSLTPQDDPNMPTYLYHLGLRLNTRFKSLGKLSDGERAMDYCTQVVSLTPQGHPEMPFHLNNLGYVYRTRFDCLGEISDLNIAIKYLAQAISAAPQDYSDMPGLLMSLAEPFRCRFDHLGELEDLHITIEYLTQGLSIAQENYLWTPIMLGSLGAALQIRFERLGELVDLNMAIENSSQALIIMPHDNSFRPAYSATTLLARKVLKRTQSLSEGSVIGSSSPSEIVPSALASSSRASLARFAMKARRTAAISSLSRPTLPTNLFAVAALIPSAIASRISSSTCWAASRNVSIEAAAVAIAMNEYSLALEWLEEGRSIVWKQITQLRTPVDELFSVAPALSVKLKQVARDLDYASSPKLKAFMNSQDAPSLEQAAQQHRRLAETWQSILGQARSLPGFESFLCPQKAPKLMGAAQSGPVVIVNIHKSRCDALLLQPGSNMVSHIPLALPYEVALRTRFQVEHLVRSRGQDSRYPVFNEPASEDTFGNTMTVVWTGVIKPVIDFLGYTQSPSSGNLPHITWCATGPLSFLPLHAAGDYESQCMTFDYVVSSYTPTLSALLSPLPSAAFSGLLAVGQESTLGMPSLPGTVAELAEIQEKARGHKVTKIDGNLATPDAVLTGMETHSWVHIACHAKQNLANPMQSAFYLHGGMLDLASIVQKQLKNADLAFLSACQTATGDEKLSEEAVHLAAGMLIAGYRGVIATMWSIGDEDASLIAGKVYEYLLEEGKPDARRAAVALHKATECLREKFGVKAFAKWVPYIHIGL
ncbi:hypothetical protein BDV93DRAFT_576264, partial [Ceratobasidium sp. AG-I]